MQLTTCNQVTLLKLTIQYLLFIAPNYHVLNNLHPFVFSI